MVSRFPHEIEISIKHKAPRSWICENVETGEKLILPFKCVEGGEDALIEGKSGENYVLNVNDWWWQKVAEGEFKAGD
jgi:hypothetical protein